MNQTRKILILERVFTLEDLSRIASIFEKQSKLASKSEHNASIEYSIRFSDNTTYQSDSPDLFLAESLAVPARPVAIQMSFHNYTLGRHISLSLSHGDFSYSNEAVVSSREPDWLCLNFIALKEAIEAVRSQTFWLRKHRILLLNLIALGIGSLMTWVTDLLLNVLANGIDLSGVIKPLPPDSPWRRVISNAAPLLCTIKWLWCWAVGFLLGAFEVRRWLLSVWPSIEFDFGLPQFKAERIKRRRLLAVVTLIVIPIIRSLFYDLIRSTF